MNTFFDFLPEELYPEDSAPVDPNAALDPAAGETPSSQATDTQQNRELARAALNQEARKRHDDSMQFQYTAKELNKRFFG